MNLKGETIYLRLLTEYDVNETYLSWLNDNDITYGLATKNYSMESLKSYVHQRLEDQNCHFYAICDVLSDKHIGNIKLDFFDSKANLYELGILIGDKSYWGKGIGTQACRLVLEYGFKKLNARKIWLAVYENNLSAKKVYENLGFKLEGCLRKHISLGEKYYDKYLMGIFNSEWEEQFA
jgi:RimJ/RimL family protein N-acetyltransferase